MRPIKFIIYIISLFSILSCKESVSGPKTKTEILVSKVWMIQEVNASGYLQGQVFLRGKTPEGSPYDLSKVRVTFKSDGTAFAIDNTGNSTATGKWKLGSNEIDLLVSDTNNFLLDGTGTVLGITETEFSFKGSRTYRSNAIDATVRMVPAL
ncbi:hypothetical protein V7S79_00705 [Aquirufa sp. ROCK-SH2]